MFHAGVSLHGSYLMPSLDRARVADAMHPGVLTCAPDASLTDAARLIATHHVHCLVVPSPAPADAAEASGWTVVTDRDIVRAGLAGFGEPSVGELSSSALVTTSPDAPLRATAEAMLADGVSHALVIDRPAGRPVGILSTLDIAGVLAWGEG